MRLAVFGATGTVGTAVVARAVAEGHTVRALVRDRRRRSGPLPGAVQTVVGDVRDTGAVRDTVAGAEAGPSSLGGVHAPRGLSIRTGHVLPVKGERGSRRLHHLDMPGAPHTRGRAVVAPLLWLGSRRLVPASRELARTLQSSDVDWTLVRAPRVVPGDRTGRVRTGHLRLSPLSHVRVGDVAEVMLRCLTDPSTVRTAPMVAAAR